MKNNRFFIDIIRSNIFLLIMILICTGCATENKYSKENYLYTDFVDRGLYCEHYKVDSYGVGGDVYSIYLTDSLMYRKFICLYYDSESFELKVNEDKVFITKLEDVGGINGGKRTRKKVQEYSFWKSDLKNEGIMD